MKNIKLSSRERDEAVDVTSLSLNFEMKYQEAYSAAMITKDLMASGYDTEKAIKEEFKLRDIETNPMINKIIKKVLENGSIS